MGRSQLVLISVLGCIIPIIFAQNVTMGRIVVDGTTTVAETDENYICMTLDIWPFDECPTKPCLWDGNASVLNLVRNLGD